MSAHIGQKTQLTSQLIFCQILVEGQISNSSNTNVTKNHKHHLPPILHLSL